MKIGIDARFFGSKEKGLGVYVKKLVEHLEKNNRDKNFHFYVFLRKERYEDYKPKNKNFHKIVADYKWYSWEEQLLFPFFLKKYALDLMHFSHFNVPILYNKKIIITIHDLILFHFPTFRSSKLNRFYYFFKLLMYRLVINIAIKKAQKIIAISNFTKKDLIKTFKISDKKIKVIYQGCNFFTKKEQKKVDDIFKKYGIIKPYLLYVGNAYPHKNLEKLVDVFSVLNKKYPKIKLVLAGGEDYFYQRLKKKIEKRKQQNIILAGFIEDEDLTQIYQKSEAVVFPSLYEGFGFPPLEALIYDKPVACSNRTSMPEILGDSVEYFNPENHNSILKAIIKVIENKPKSSKDKIKKLKSKFNWNKTAKNTLKVYKSVAKS